MGIYSIDDIRAIKNNYTNIPDELLVFLSNKTKLTKKINKTSYAIHTVSNNYNTFQLSIKELLNKINESNYDSIVSQFDKSTIQTLEELEFIIANLLEKVLREEKYANVYSNLSHYLSNVIITEDNKESNFRKILLLECQKIFIKYTTQSNIKKSEIICYMYYLSYLYNRHILSTDILFNCCNTLVNKISKNNLMIDSLIIIIKISSNEFKKRDLDKYNNIYNRLRELCNTSQISIREKLLLEEVL